MYFEMTASKFKYLRALYFQIFQGIEFIEVSNLVIHVPYFEVVNLLKLAK